MTACRHETKHLLASPTLWVLHLQQNIYCHIIKNQLTFIETKQWAISVTTMKMFKDITWINNHYNYYYMDIPQWNPGRFLLNLNVINAPFSPENCNSFVCNTALSVSTQHLQSAFRFMTVQNSGKTRKLKFFLYAMQCVFKSWGILSLTQISKIFYDWIVICSQCLTITINYY